MDTVRSADGTEIAFDRVGDGPPLVCVGGVLKAGNPAARRRATASPPAESWRCGRPRGVPITRLAMYEPPIGPDNDSTRREDAAHGTKLAELIAADRRGDALELIMSRVGIPGELVSQIRRSPMWAGLEALVPTLPYDRGGHGLRHRARDLGRNPTLVRAAGRARCGWVTRQLIWRTACHTGDSG